MPKFSVVRINRDGSVKALPLDQPEGRPMQPFDTVLGDYEAASADAALKLAKSEFRGIDERNFYQKATFKIEFAHVEERRKREREHAAQIAAAAAARRPVGRVDEPPPLAFKLDAPPNLPPGVYPAKVTEVDPNGAVTIAVEPQLPKAPKPDFEPEKFVPTPPLPSAPVKLERTPRLGESTSDRPPSRG